MRITLEGDTAILLQPTAGQLTIEALTPDLAYGAFHMLGSALAMCTFAVLASWASHSKLEADDLHIRVSWQFAENPHRVASLREEIHWPSLPTERRAAAERAAALCAVHATLSNSVTIETEVS